MLKVLSCHDTCDDALMTIFKSVMAKMLYASPAWLRGGVSRHHQTNIHALGVRLSLYANHDPIMAELAANLENNSFATVLS